MSRAGLFFKADTKKDYSAPVICQRLLAMEKEHLYALISTSWRQL
jgi:hypothetical protein